MRHTSFASFAPLAAVLVLLSAGPLAGQEASSPRFEIGLVGSDLRSPGLATRGIGFAPDALGLSVDLFLTDRLVLSPSVTGVVWGDDGLTAVRLRTDVRYLLGDPVGITPYVLASGTAEIRTRNAFLPGEDFAVGAGFGVRVPIARWLTTSLELRYDRWLTTGADQFGLAFRISIPIGGR